LRLVTEDWRLKLLGVALAVLLLGAVAFSQNQPTTNTLSIGLNYVVTSPDIILINPPAKTNITYSGLASAVANVNSSNLLATVDTTGARPGTAVRLNVTPKSLVQGVTPQQPAPIAVNIDTRQSVQIPVQVKATAATGWEIDPTKTLATCPGARFANPCRVQFDGPVTWESGLKAVTTVSGVAAAKNNLLNQPVQLQAAVNIDLSPGDFTSVSHNPSQQQPDIQNCGEEVHCRFGQRTPQNVERCVLQTSRGCPKSWTFCWVRIRRLPDDNPRRIIYAGYVETKWHFPCRYFLPKSATMARKRVILERFF